MRREGNQRHRRDPGQRPQTVTTGLRGAVAVILVLTVAACSAGGPTQAGARVEIQVYAAASLKAVLANVKTAFEAATPDVSLLVSTDSSAALAAKIEQGAPADVFLSADTANPQKLVDGGLAVGGNTVFAGNHMTVIVPAENRAGITSPADLARPGVKVIAAAESVPLTTYATRLVDNLAALPGYPAGFANAYAANVASREDNAGSVVAKIALGEGDVAIVYATDAAASDKVKAIAVPANANVAASCGAVLLARSKVADAAKRFLDWLLGPDGQALLVSHGFTGRP